MTEYVKGDSVGLGLLTECPQHEGVTTLQGETETALSVILDMMLGVAGYGAAHPVSKFLVNMVLRVDYNSETTTYLNATVILNES